MIIPGIAGDNIFIKNLHNVPKYTTFAIEPVTTQVNDHDEKTK